MRQWEFETPEKLLPDSRVPQEPFKVPIGLWTEWVHHFCLERGYTPAGSAKGPERRDGR